ncbi:hypothetical protein CMO89_03905 [Candidatus Woesearchaeota archaeon]|nr:hypothetical protein [Candidatus Woesearchaeota archaeon]|tara:strand:+ start:2873 stop:3085 length:213 start_codon:yes stop_codon:yes gene_type:complete
MAKKIHIELSSKAQKELEELKGKLDASTITEVIRASLSVTKFLELQKEKGNEIIIRDPKSNKETRVLTLR